MTESVSGSGPRPADDYVRGAQVAPKRDTPPTLNVGPGSAGPTPAPQPVPKDPRSQTTQNEANTAIYNAQKAAQQAQKNFNTALGTYNVAAANLVHKKESDPERNRALTDVSLKVENLKKAAEAQADACQLARDVALKTGDQKKIDVAEEAYGKAKVQLNTAEQVVKMVHVQVEAAANAVLARMGLSTTSQRGASINPGAVAPQNKTIPLPSTDQIDDATHKQWESARTHAKEAEKKLFDAFDELDNALDNLQNAKNDKLRGNRQVNVDKQLDDAKRQVREAAQALETASTDNVEAWDLALAAATVEAEKISDERAAALTIHLVENHVNDGSLYREAALKRSKEAIDGL